MFLRKSKINKSEDEVREIKRIGTPFRAIVTDIIVKRNGFIVTALYEDKWLGTQSNYRSRLLATMPTVRVGGEVMVYVDDRVKGRYCLDC